MSPSRQLGILGGTFDPVHYGHLSLALAARRCADLDRVLMVPSGQPPHKPQGAAASAADRLAMVRLAAEDQPGLEVWDGEVKRDGPSRTYDTLVQLATEFADCDLHFILGSDALREIASWYRYPEVLDLAIFVVCDRPGERLLSLAELEAIGIASHRVRVCESSGLVDVEARQVRASIAAGHPLDGLVHPKVADYIRRNHLYMAPVGVEAED